ncbi:putative transferase caf-17, mitochondrial [Nymphon striatum]|nr:putative transferase caf-17, mitochondrial [Nymphon striatum]
MTDRTLIGLSGPDAHDFLQRLVTNNVPTTAHDLVYAALLTPQGKFIADFFMSMRDAVILIDVASPHAPTLAQRLSMYKLRADTALWPTRVILPSAGGYMTTSNRSDDTNWDALRVEHIIPETGIELTPDTYILEAGFERLNGIDFRKGCYVGQEIAARMKHKTELRKGLTQVTITGSAPVGSDITADGKPAGTLFTQSGGRALAYLRFDRATGDMKAGDAHLHRP